MIPYCQLFCIKGHYQTTLNKEQNGTCSECTQVKQHINYIKTAEKKKIYQKAYRLAHIERVNIKDREKHLRRNYDITTEQYEEIMVKQGRVCAICRKPEKFRKHLSVDHNHTTGEVRGLLCNFCNYGMGFLDNSDFMAAAKAYFQR